MQKNIHYWLLAAGCVSALTFFVSTKDSLVPIITADILTDTPLCSDIVGYWKFDEGTGTVAEDESANNNTADLRAIEEKHWDADTAEGILFWNQYSLNFPGNGYLKVETGSNLDLSEDTTLSLWVKYAVLDSAEDANVLLAFGGQTEETQAEEKKDNYLYLVNINGSNKALRMSWENGSDSRDIVLESSLVSSLTTGVWSHIVITRNAAKKEVAFYENGSQIGAIQDYTIIPSGSSGGKLFIGAAPHDLASTFFNGHIDDVRIYNKVLSYAQIIALHQNSDLLTGCTCGNLEIEPPEQCDDGNMISTDACTTSCTVARCGDGYVQTGNGEECEPAGTPTCSSECKQITTSSAAASSESSMSIPESCGNRITEEDEGEQCDDGHLNGKGPCSIYCTDLFCGDAILSPEISEECEPIPQSIVNGIPTYVQPTCGDACAIPEIDSKTNKIIAGCTRLFLPPCDAQSSHSTSSSASEELSSETVVRTLCGDGIVQSDEQCDNGSVCTNDTAISCSEDTDCSVDVNGTVRTGRCIYNYDLDDTCTNLCISLVEDSNNTGATISSSAPISSNAVCGNFLLEIGEECDDGVMNSDSDPNACRNDCTVAFCGDGVIDLNEDCDAATSNSDVLPDSCRTNCRFPICGDGVRDSGEDCDGGASCSDDCSFLSFRTCGNGLLEGNEQCDDGNILPGDGCSSLCVIEPKLMNVESSFSSSSSSAGKVAGGMVQNTTPSYVPPISPDISVSVATSSTRSLYTIQPIQVQSQVTPPATVLRPLATVIPRMTSQHAPVGDTGPAALLIVAAGSTGGFLWRRRRKKD